MTLRNESTIRMSLAVMVSIAAGLVGGSLTISSKADKAELTPIREKQTALEITQEKIALRQEQTNDLLKEVKESLKDLNNKVDGVNSNSIATLREVIKIKEGQIPPQR